MALFSGSFETDAMTDDFFRNRLDQMIDLRHPLAVLANRMPWQEIEASLAQRWARQVKAGKKIEDLDLFGPFSALSGGGVSNAGRPRLPTRLMVALLYLKHAFNESDEEVIQRWGETPTWQYFSGNEYFEHQWPCDPTQLGRFRKALGEEGVEELLARTMEVCNDPLKSCSGHTIGEISHEYDDGRRHQEVDGQAQSGFGHGDHSRQDLDFRG